MTDAFSDVSNSQNATERSGNESTDDSNTATTFADMGVRSETTLEDIEPTGDVYEDPETGKEADDVDASSLFKTATINDIRYYAREGPYGPPLVRKPIDDAFKHGFEVKGDNTEREDGEGTISEFLHDYAPHYKKAERKSRRDGMAVLEFKFADAAESTSEPIKGNNVTHTGYQIWTLDNLSGDLAESKAAEYTDYDRDQLHVSTDPPNDGIVIVDDVSHPDHGDIVGYGVQPRSQSDDVQSVAFLHAERCQHFTWGEWVDGDYGNNLTGKHVGESVLTPVLQPLKAAQMGYWAQKNILYRYSAPLHAVEPPEAWGTDDWEEVREEMEDISMRSDALLPPGAALEVAEGVSEFDPEPIYDVLVESICAGTEFTKPVLQGTQTGTVSGSETDIKGYFNEVNVIRTSRTEQKFHGAIKKVSKYDQSTVPRVAGVDSYDIDWGPLFKPTAAEQAEGAISLITAATNGIKNYVITPDEARSLISEEWASFDIDIDLDELTEDEWDQFDRINIRETGQLSPEDEPDVGGTRENPRLKNGGGQPQGQTRGSSQPQRTTADSLDEDVIDEIAERVVEKLE